MLDTQDIIDGTCANLISNGTAFRQYQEIGKPTAPIEVNLRMLYALYLAIPYFDADPANDITEAQLIIEKTRT